MVRKTDIFVFFVLFSRLRLAALLVIREKKEVERRKANLKKKRP